MGLVSFNKGTLRVYGITAIAMLAGYMSGYDSGVAGSVLTFATFRESLNFGKSDTTRVTSFTISLQQLGSFLACFVVWGFMNYFGRRLAVVAFGSVFVIGAIIETINTGTISAWYVARIVAGFGLGGCIVVVPVYVAEMAPRRLRGTLTGMYQLLYTYGVFVAYWVDYGVNRNMKKDGAEQWQIPIGLQLIWITFLILGMALTRESVRWLATKNKMEKALANLLWIRGVEDANDEKVNEELREINTGIELDVTAREGFRISEMWHPVNLRKLLLGCAIFLFQNATGANALANFAPQFFKSVVGPGDRDILLTALFGAVKAIACTIYIFGFAEHLGRRTALFWGALGQAACMLIVAIILKYNPVKSSSEAVDGSLTATGRAMIAMIFLDVAIYNFSWGPVCWTLVPELFSTRFRAFGVACCVAVHWLTAFVISVSTPYMLADIKWGTFLFYSLMDMIMAVFVIFFVKETIGRSLEDLQADWINSGDKLDLEESNLAQEVEIEHSHRTETTDSATKRDEVEVSEVH